MVARVEVGKVVQQSKAVTRGQVRAGRPGRPDRGAEVRWKLVQPILTHLWQAGGRGGGDRRTQRVERRKE